MKKKTNANKIEHLSTEKTQQIDPDISTFLREWTNSSDYICVNSSGSTGSPKVINLKKSAVINSAKATNKFFQLTEKSIFLQCLPAKYIAGKMMLVRCIEAKAKLIFSNSFHSPLEGLNESIDFCAMTPHQAKISFNQYPDNFKWIKTLILGGGPIDSELEDLLQNIATNCFHTFGMTETISHVAVREISKSNSTKLFTCLPDITISTNNNNQLIINAKYLLIKKLVTNDIVEIIDSNSFIWKGRLDNIINSGGIKLHPEHIEAKLHLNDSTRKYIIDKLADNNLGEQLILIVDSTINDLELATLFSSFKKYEIPKRIYELTDFIYTENNKINRKKTKEKAINLGKWYKPCL